MPDLDDLRAALTEFRDALGAQSAQLADRHASLTRSYLHLAEHYDGAAARDFKQGWQRTVEDLEAHREALPALVAFLDERLERLAAFDRGDDG